MMKLPFVIMSRKAYEKRMHELDKAFSKCAELEIRLNDAKKAIEDMKCGNLKCDNYCESCKNAFIRIEKTIRGDYVNVHCKLIAANTCVGYQPVDPA